MEQNVIFACQKWKKLKETVFLNQNRNLLTLHDKRSLFVKV